MNRSSKPITLEGCVGSIEAILDEPATFEDLPARAQDSAQKGMAIICHPHPLFGGTMDNKVVQTLARAFLASGWRTLRFNFRGVGSSAGVHDNGVGEVADLLRVISQFANAGPLALAGFSFGAFIASHGVQAIYENIHEVANATPPSNALRQGKDDLKKVVLVGTATTRFDVRPIATDLHERTLVIHGEDDDTVPLASVMSWAKPQVLPVTVIPGVGHFFHGQLPLLKSLVMQHLK